MEVGPEEISALLEAALARRAGLLERSDLDAYRLFHGYGEGERRLRIERFGDTAILTHKVALEAPAIDAALTILDAYWRPSIVVARRYRGHNFDARPTEIRVLRGTLPSDGVIAREGDLCFRVRPDTVGLVGLFVDARPARDWLRTASADRRILNLFAFTGSLGLAALRGGARAVSHVDSDASALAIARENHALNDLPVDDRDFVRSDVYRALQRIARGRTRFGGVILDPPPMVRPRGSRGRPRPQDFRRLAGLCAPVLDEGGWLLCFFNRPGRPLEAFEAEVVEGAAGVDVALEPFWRGTSGPDFVEARPEGKLRFVAFRRPANAA